jgi:hypothetical protein
MGFVNVDARQHLRRGYHTPAELRRVRADVRELQALYGKLTDPVARSIVADAVEWNSQRYRAALEAASRTATVARRRRLTVGRVSAPRVRARGRARRSVRARTRRATASSGSSDGSSEPRSPHHNSDLDGERGSAPPLLGASVRGRNHATWG